jgi:hypothetical protein
MHVAGNQLTVTVTTPGPAVAYVTPPSGATPPNAEQTIAGGSDTAVFEFNTSKMGFVKVDIYGHADHSTCSAIPG